MIAPVRTLTITPRGQAQFRFPLDRVLQAELKVALPGVVWNGTARAWTVLAKPVNIRAIRTFARVHGFAGVEEAEETQGRMFAAVRQTMAASRAGDAQFVAPVTLRGTLRPFQKAGVAFMVAHAHGCLVADEMGLGKTVETIATLETLEAFPAVIVCPASLKLNWEREWTEWAPHRRVAVVDGSRCSWPGRPPEVVIINYDLLPKNVEALRTLDARAVVFDEGHLLKNAKAARSVAARRLRRGVRYRFVLTGTPVLNTPSELLHPLSLLGRLDDLGGFWHFAERYCGGKKVEVKVAGKVKGRPETKEVWDLTGSSNLPELAGRLRATCMLRRRKRDVLPELPRKQLSFLPVDLPPRERREYDLAERDVLKWVARKAGRDAGFRAAIGHLPPTQQLGAILLRAQRAADRAAQAEELVRIEALKQISARGKLKAAEEWIGNFLAGGEKLVVFGWHNEALAPLAEAFSAPLLDGATPTAARQAMVDLFQQGPAALQFLNLQAGGVGLTLTAASNVLVLEFPWTPALLDQAIDRCHRIGQLRSVNAWLMMGRQTIDFPIWQMLQQKRSTAETALQ